MTETAEKTNKVEVIAMYSELIPDGQEDVDYIFYGVQGFNEAGKRVKAMVSYPIPKTDEEAVETYNCNLAHIIALGVRAGIATRPNYPLEFAGRTTDKDGKLTARGIINQEVVEACQTLADNYKVGMKKVSKETTITKAVKQSGLSTEEAMEAIKLYLANKNK